MMFINVLRLKKFLLKLLCRKCIENYCWLKKRQATSLETGDNKILSCPIKDHQRKISITLVGN